MKERMKELGYWLEDKLKGLCGEITPDKRLTVIIVMLLLFTILNLYLTFTSIKTWGMEEEPMNRMEIEYMKGLELLDSRPKIPLLDSINIENTELYGG